MGYTLFDWIIRGGWVMAPIVACSCVALGIVVERIIWGLPKSKIMPRELSECSIELIRAGNTEQLLGMCRRDSSALASLIIVAVNNANQPRAELIDTLEHAGKREARKLQRFVGTLGVIAAICPLLGLLGTVFGMIEIFNVIDTQGTGNAQALAGGIAEALITTAGGLTVAIPALVFHRLFMYRIKSLLLDIESFCLNIVDTLTKKQTRATLAASQALYTAPKN